MLQLQDLTSYGVVRAINEMSEEERNTFHHIVVPDLEKLGSRKVVVREEILSMFRILMDEGIKDVSTGKIVLHLKEPMTLGILMCTTPEDLGDKRSVFRTLSFQSRVLPFSYDYSAKLRVGILDFVEKEEHAVAEKFFFKREEKVNVELPELYSKALTPYAIKLSRTLERFSRKSPIKDTEEKDRLIGIRPKENLMSFLKSIALYDGRTTVQRKDFVKFRSLYRYMNYNFRDIDCTGR